MERPYFPFLLPGKCRVAVQKFERLDEVGSLTAQRTVPLHCHAFYEMVLILRGGCKHLYQEDQTSLLPGDLFLIPPHRAHAYRFSEDVVHYNCQFYEDTLAEDWRSSIEALCYDRLKESFGAPQFSGAADINRQGIIHLDHDETDKIHRLLDDLLAEQNHPGEESARMRATLLQMLLLTASRARAHQFANADKHDSWKQRMIDEVLARFEGDLTADWDFTKLAEGYHISSSYFRMIFKDVTGLPPRQYLNRMRMIRAVDLIHRRGLSLCETAEQVGIYDLNYFSRLCKKVMGYPPSHFRRKNSEKI